MERNASSAITVTQLNARIKNLLDSDDFLANIAVTGELSNYKVYPSGHHYFTLKDADSGIRCVMFKSAASKLRFKPENGMSVVIYGSVTVYMRDGAYQIYCVKMTPEGAGDLHVAFEQLKDKLSKEGLFDAAHKKPLPKFPRKIAIITSEAGAAVRDMIRILGSRWPVAEVVVLPVRVQGAEAPFEIAGAIRYANLHNVADLIITGRGGGSIEDLWAFNDEGVARAIYASEIPVISAVGHEPDITIADYVADLRAATPSNAAELAVPNESELRETLSHYGIRNAGVIRKILSAYRTKLSDLSQRRVMQSPSAYIDTRRMSLDFALGQLTATAQRYLASRRERFIRLAASMDALSPLAVISRGYSIPLDEKGAVLRSAAAAEIGGRLNLVMGDGELSCKIVDKTIKVDKDAKKNTEL